MVPALTAFRRVSYPPLLHVPIRTSDSFHGNSCSLTLQLEMLCAFQDDTQLEHV